MESTNVTVVIPTLNEVKNVPVLVQQLEEELPRKETTIIIVDDNSQDGTAEAAQELNITFGNVNVIRRSGRLGIGSAVLDGMRVALSNPATQHVATMDGDLSHNPRELVTLLEQANGSHLVVGSRYVPGGSIIGWGFQRKLISWGINTSYRLLFRTGLRDHTSFFRVYSRECAEMLVSQIRCAGYELGIAAILACKNCGYSIKEVPISFVDRTQGSSKLRPRDLFQVFRYASTAFWTNGIHRWHS